MQRVQHLTVLLVIWAITITCARITVNVYFPAAEIRDAASRIEREVRQGDGTPTTPPANAPSDAPKPQSFRWWPLRLALTVPTATAQQQLDITISTPAIRRLIASRKQRYPHLVPFFDQGALGENNRGLVEIRTLEGLSLRDKAQIKALVEQENSDRQQLYRALADANNISSDRVDEIAAIFAEVNRKQAKSGWKVQAPNGVWQTK